MPIPSIREIFYWVNDIKDRKRVAGWSREKLEKRHEKQFRELVTFVNEHSPYYQRRFRELDIDVANCQLTDLPILDKQDVIEHFDELITVKGIDFARVKEFATACRDPLKLLDDEYFVVRSSGTSGAVSYLLYSVREWIRGCSHQTRVTGRLGFRRRSAFVGIVHDRFAGVSLTSTGKRGINRLFYDCRVLDVREPMDVIVEKLNKFQPHVLSAYVTALRQLGDEIKAGRLKIRPESVISSGEILAPDTRRELDDRFGVPIQNVYSTSETLILGAGTSESDGLTLFEDDILIEVNEDHICVTNLFNRTIPLLRYRLNDRLTVKADVSSHGPFQVVEDIIGRNVVGFDLRINSGKMVVINPTLIACMSFDGVARFQVRKNSDTRLEFRVQYDAAADEAQRQTALREIKQELDDLLRLGTMDESATYEVVEVDDIPVDPDTGKYRVMVNAS
jgi:phenylacetate-CoA ligase